MSGEHLQDHWSYLSNKNFHHRFSAFMRAKVFKFFMHLESGQVYCGKENQNAEINFCLLLPFCLFSISHSNVIHRKICVKDFSGTTAPRILKFGTNVGYDLLYCVKENQTSAAYHSLYLSIFLPIHSDFLLQISQFLREPVFKFCIHYESSHVYFGKENLDAEIQFILLSPFFLFSISHSSVIHMEICVKDFSATTAPRILTFGTNVGNVVNDLLYYVSREPDSSYLFFP